MLTSMINRGEVTMYRLFTIKQNSVLLILCLIFVGCSYTPNRYSFSLIEPQNEKMSFVDSDVEFRFVPSSENIRVTIKNKADYEIYLVRDNAEYIDYSGESYRIHYGDDYVEEVLNFEMENKRFATPFRIKPGSEISGFIWINNWPDGHIGQGPDDTPILSHNILNRMEPFFPRYSFEGSVEGLKSSTFNLILPIDFGEYVRNYTFTFKIDDVIEGKKS
jgi:uncharacterized lipoprotein YehR (DUF1307 family)